jgi:hypothetical protein
MDLNPVGIRLNFAHNAQVVDVRAWKPQNNPEGAMSSLQSKVIKLMNWFATNREPLKRLVFVIEPVANSKQLDIKQLKFHGSNDLLD